ncbi:MAG TPA: ATPase domain-containing protein [Micropepsaceae bacterium]|nr:ATPase domain-containing protein [Micropepsaceae bacterium]
MASKRNRANGARGDHPAAPPPKVAIRKLATGIPGLDGILYGGLPEFSFNIISGGPGSGKTTLAHQFIFANATPERPALYFTILGESPIKMLRYQQQYAFFDPARLNRAIHFINLSEAVLERGLREVLDEIIKQVETVRPAFVVVDSFRTALRRRPGVDEMEVQFFVQQLAQHLTTWEATTFLIGEYSNAEMNENPVFTVADGVFWLTQVTERNSVVRKLQILKSRGQASVPGLHTFRITEAGVQTFSRTLGLEKRRERPDQRPRLSTGVAELDAMMGGGIPMGDSLLIAGSSGTGKSAFGTHFVAEGIRRDEHAIMAVFEERPEDCLRRARHLGQDLDAAVRAGKLKLLYLRPLDLSVDESLQAIIDAVSETGAKRLVIDSLVGFEMALAPGFRTDFRESLYRMMASLTNTGVTVLSTVEVDESFTEFRFTHYMVSFLADDIVRLRYVDMDGELRRILTVVKMRDSSHSKDIREYEITQSGVQLTGARFNQYRAMISGIPAYWRSQ